MGNGNYYLYVVLRGDYSFRYPSWSCMEEIWKLMPKEDFFLGRNGWDTITRSPVQQDP